MYAKSNFTLTLYLPLIKSLTDLALRCFRFSTIALTSASRIVKAPRSNVPRYAELIKGRFKIGPKSANAFCINRDLMSPKYWQQLLRPGRFTISAGELFMRTVLTLIRTRLISRVRGVLFSSDIYSLAKWTRSGNDAHTRVPSFAPLFSPQTRQNVTPSHELYEFISLFSLRSLHDYALVSWIT